MLAVDKGCRVLWQGDRRIPQDSILGDKLRHHPHCPYTLTPPQNCSSISWAPTLTPVWKQPLTVPSAHSLPPACSWLSAFWLRCSLLSYPSLHPVLQDLSYQYHAAQGASEMISLGSMYGESGHLSSLHTLSSQHLTQRLVQGRHWENVRSWMS